MNDDTPRRPLSIGEFRLCPTWRGLVGSHGHLEVDATLYALVELLMQRPGVVVETRALIAAMPRDVTRTPSGAARALAEQVHKLRVALMMLMRGRVRLQGKPGFGYSTEAWR